MLSLHGLVAPPPLPMLLAIAIAAGIGALGAGVQRRLGWRHATPLEHALGFVASIAVLAGALKLSVELGLVSLWPLRLLAWAIAAAGVLATLRSLGPAREKPWWWATLGDPSLGAFRWVVGGVVLASFAAALGPATDVDSLDYHLGAPLEWLRHGGVHPRVDWLELRLAGLGEALALLGLAGGTDALVAVLQACGVVVALAAVGQGVEAPALRRLGALAVAGTPVLLALVPSQKALVLPAAGVLASAVSLLASPEKGAPRHGWPPALALGFAVGCKVSFVVGAGVVVLAALVSKRQPPRWLGAVAVASAALVLPTWVANTIRFADPVTPLLERFKAAPDPEVVALADYLRAYVDTSHGHWLGLMVPFTPGELSVSLGLGVTLVALVSWSTPTSRVLAITAVATAALMAIGGQRTGRFFLEAQWLIVAAACRGPSPRWAPPVIVVFAAHAVVVLLAATLAAALALPGAFTVEQRARVIADSASGAREVAWLDETLPPEALVWVDLRTTALLARPFVSPRHFDFGARLEVAAAQGATHALLATRGASTRRAWLEACGVAGTLREVELEGAARNPWRRGTRYWRTFVALDFTQEGCRRLRSGRLAAHGRGSE